MPSSVRCLNCRHDFEDSHDYLVHACEPHPSTLADWDPEAVDPDERLAEIAAIGDRIAELVGEMIELEHLAGVLELEEEDPFFDDWDEDPVLPIGVLRGILLGAVLAVGLVWVAVEYVAASIRKLLR